MREPAVLRPLPFGRCYHQLVALLSQGVVKTIVPASASEVAITDQSCRFLRTPIAQD